MTTNKRHKKNLIVSYKNLSDDLKALFKEAYPEGYKDYITKFVKPNGEAIYVVPFETEDTAYMVKFDVKIDSLGEDLDKALFDEDGDEGKDEEFAPLSEALEKEEENPSHRERHLRHGDFEDVLEKKDADKLDIDREGLKEALDAEDEDIDSYETLDDEPSDEDFEPSDEDLRGIEEEYLDAEIPPLDATIADIEDMALIEPEQKPKHKSTSPSNATAKNKSAKSAATKSTAAKSTAKKTAPAKKPNKKTK